MIAKNYFKKQLKLKGTKLQKEMKCKFIKFKTKIVNHQTKWNQ